MNEVSHREFTRVKDHFDKSWIHNQTYMAPMNRTPDDDWCEMVWFLNGEKGTKLFSIMERTEYPDCNIKKTYRVHPEAYRILRIIDMVRGTDNSNFSNSKDISW